MCDMSNALQGFRPESLCLLKESQDNCWRFSRQPSEDFFDYTADSSIYEEPCKVKYKEGSDVLVRWTDGLLYLGNIIKVEDEYGRCAVKFEDGSQYWALYKDIHKGPPPGGEIVCTVCDSGTSQKPDEIVICDKCSLGYHQLCHIPVIDSSVLKPDIHWWCRKCIFACTTKKGGALKKGPYAQAMQVMKQQLPYDLQSLTWDIPHRSNFQQTYCYCGGPGEWYMKMLQCSRCKQWFHEACLQCLEEPLLFGDRFYIFVCSVCNKGPEFLRRLALKWQDIAHLVLFSLTVQLGKKYFDLETTIMTFLTDNWSQFQVQGELLCTSVEDRRQKLLETFQNNKSRFKSGKEVKRKTTLWGLRSRVPPPVPVITLPDSVPVTDDVLDAFKPAGRKSKFIVKPDRTPVSLKRKRKHSVESDACDSATQPQKNAVENGYVQRVKQVKTRKMSRNQNYILRKSVRKLSLSSSMSASEAESEDTSSSSQGTLNLIIPPPNNFEGLNHPFRCNEKSRSCKSQSSAASNQTQSSNTCVPQKVKRPKRIQRIRVSNKSGSFLNQLIGTCDLDCGSGGSVSKIVVNKGSDSAVLSPKSDLSDLNSSVNSYFGAADRIANGEKFNVLAKRITADGKVQHLIEWEGLSS